MDDPTKTDEPGARGSSFARRAIVMYACLTLAALGGCLEPLESTCSFGTTTVAEYAPFTDLPALRASLMAHAVVIGNTSADAFTFRVAPGTSSHGEATLAGDQLRVVVTEPGNVTSVATFVSGIVNGTAPNVTAFAWRQAPSGEPCVGPLADESNVTGAGGAGPDFH